MNQAPSYRPDIDGLRAVAVLAVVFHHLSSSLVPGGYIGVDVFFVISGYLITKIISREMEEGSFTFVRFYERRVRRIFPALFSVLIITTLAGYFLLLPSDYISTLRGMLGTLFFSSNVVFWRDMAAGYFAATDATLNPLLHTWSLGVEEQFYVLFPLLLLLCFRYFKNYIVWILIAGSIVSLTSAALLVNSKSVAVFFLLPFRAWELSVGALLAFNTVPVLRSRALRELVAGIGLVIIITTCFIYDSKTTFPGLTALAPVVGAAAVIHAGAGNGLSVAGRLLRWRPVVYVGLISYSLYLWHWPLIVLTRYAMGMEPLTSYIPVLFVASLALGSLSYHFIEQPFRRNRRVTRKFTFLSSAVFSSVLAFGAVVGLMGDGFEERYDPKVVKLDKARTPQIPFVQCDWCTLGNSNTTAHVLLWGDSHMLAWAPGLNENLTRQGDSAVLVYRSACPPMLGVNNSLEPTCLERNFSVKNYLFAHPEIKTIIMAAYWSTYFREDGPLSLHKEKERVLLEGTAAAKEALVSTLDWLRNNGKQVILVGPVPVYDKSVPLALAQGISTNRNLIHSTVADQRHRNAPFFDVVETIKEAPLFLFLDPIEWMCNDDCLVLKDGIPLYRDSHHLSVAGAMALSMKISHGLATLSASHAVLNNVAVKSVP